MTFHLPELPFAPKALEPYLSSETMEYHHGKHHRGYVDNLNKLIIGTEYEQKSLLEIVKTASGAIFNNAAQHMNHSFYWQGLTLPKTTKPSQELLSAITKKYGSFENFQKEFTQSAVTLFGSGWTWLVKKPDGSLAIVNTNNAGNPILDGYQPLLTCDVWEHAYYIDYRNARAKYAENFWQVVNWDFVNQNFLL